MWKTCQKSSLEGTSPVDLIVQEIMRPGKDQLVAYRHRKRWVQSYKHLPLQKEDGLPKMIRPNGVYLITGGLGGIGFFYQRCWRRKEMYIFI
ncbi:hypothetical protein ACEQPO_05090 [Bacillus sp. SL00103]